MANIRTVLGDIASDEFGLTLVHEHILVDPAGADKPVRSKYDSEEVFEVMLPYLVKIKNLGVKSLVECTPAYMGRDVKILARLSAASGIHILTNTGLFMEPYIPKHAFECSTDELAKIWINEIENGIEGTSIKAGFIKIAVKTGELTPIYEKLVRAAARCSLATRATIACHAESGETAINVIHIIEEEGLEKNKLIVVHADSESNLEYHVQIARWGVWVEYDRISPQTSERTLSLIEFMIKHGFEDQILLSQDSGWYTVGQPRGGNIKGYEYLVESFLPLMKKYGFNQKLIDRITIENPAEAFQLE